MSESAIRQLLAAYPVTTEMAVRWGDMDAYQHVNNTVYFRYFESARIAYFEEMGMLKYRSEENIGPILGSVQCRFRIPLTYPDTITVGVTIPEVGLDRFVTRHVVISHRHGRIAAEGEGVVVMYNYTTGQKSTIPESLRQQISALEARVQKGE